MTTKTVRDRIVELRRVKAGELRPNPRNWRRHPKRQREALRALLSEIGFADAILARELEDGSLEIIDGHLRQSMSAEAILPVLVLDVDEAEADKLLATLDPLAALAIADPEPLRALLASIETSSEEVRMLLAGLATEADVRARLGLVDPDEIPEPSKPRAKPGEVFVLGEHRLACGDARDPTLLGRLMGREAARLLLSDPPWGSATRARPPADSGSKTTTRRGFPSCFARPSPRSIRCSRPALRSTCFILRVLRPSTSPTRSQRSGGRSDRGSYGSRTRWCSATRIFTTGTNP